MTRCCSSPARLIHNLVLAFHGSTAGATLAERVMVPPAAKAEDASRASWKFSILSSGLLWSLGLLIAVTAIGIIASVTLAILHWCRLRHRHAEDMIRGDEIEKSIRLMTERLYCTRNRRPHSQNSAGLPTFASPLQDTNEGEADGYSPTSENSPWYISDTHGSATEGEGVGKRRLSFPTPASQDRPHHEQQNQPLRHQRSVKWGSSCAQRSTGEPSQHLQSLSIRSNLSTASSPNTTASPQFRHIPSMRMFAGIHKVEAMRRALQAPQLQSVPVSSAYQSFAAVERRAEPSSREGSPCNSLAAAGFLCDANVSASVRVHPIPATSVLASSDVSLVSVEGVSWGEAEGGETPLIDVGMNFQESHDEPPETGKRSFLTRVNSDAGCSNIEDLESEAKNGEDLTQGGDGDAVGMVRSDSGEPLRGDAESSCNEILDRLLASSSSTVWNTLGAPNDEATGLRSSSGVASRGRELGCTSIHIVNKDAVALETTTEPQEKSLQQEESHHTAAVQSLCKDGRRFDVRGEESRSIPRSALDAYSTPSRREQVHDTSAGASSREDHPTSSHDGLRLSCARRTKSVRRAAVPISYPPISTIDLTVIAPNPRPVEAECWEMLQTQLGGDLV